MKGHTHREIWESTVDYDDDDRLNTEVLGLEKSILISLSPLPRPRLRLSEEHLQSPFRRKFLCNECMHYSGQKMMLYYLKSCPTKETHFVAWQAIYGMALAAFFFDREFIYPKIQKIRSVLKGRAGAEQVRSRRNWNWRFHMYRNEMVMVSSVTHIFQSTTFFIRTE